MGPGAGGVVGWVDPRSVVRGHVVHGGRRPSGPCEGPAPVLHASLRLVVGTTLYSAALATRLLALKAPCFALCASPNAAYAGATHWSAPASAEKHARQNRLAKAPSPHCCGALLQVSLSGGRTARRSNAQALTFRQAGALTALQVERIGLTQQPCTFWKGPHVSGSPA